ncbi:MULTISPECIES: hypothetical protein [unclassified Halorhabdus]|nr:MULTISPECIES: hypothetical protein [unclassified Halorhabdus]WEL18177.1 4-hydroxybenzoate decarboxylase subunit D [Halorhabdus sp. SVX81]WEL22055.1 4-hydroxybenzoate decarboxylase subunit D [Halorhabdus sp. BNX81]
MSALQLYRCPACGSEDRTKVEQRAVPGGTDWRYYECDSCGHEWRE